MDPKRTPESTPAQPLRLERDDADVIPIRPHLGSAGPAEDNEPIVRRPSAPAVPLADRPWRLLVVPPSPGAPTRAFHVRKWQAKLAMAAVGVLVLIAVVDIVAVVLTVRGQDPAPTAAEAAALRDGLLAMEDSITLANSVRVAQEEYEKDSAAALAVGGPKSVARLLDARRRVVDARRAVATRSYSRSPEVGKDAGSIIEGLPVIGRIASTFSYARRHPLLHLIRPHLGVDVAARYGTRIIAPADGKVTFVGKRFGYGLVIEMTHANGISTRYAHCSSVVVGEGQQVRRGVLIATVGSSGLTTGPHLHYEVMQNGRQIDPLHFRFPASPDTGGTGEGVAPQLE